MPNSSQHVETLPPRLTIHVQGTYKRFYLRLRQRGYNYNKVWIVFLLIRL